MNFLVKLTIWTWDGQKLCKKSLKDSSHFEKSPNFVVRPILVNGPNYIFGRLYFAIYFKPPHGSNLASLGLLCFNVKPTLRILISTNEHLRICGRWPSKLI